MNDWREVKLGDVVDIFDNKRIPLSNMERAKRQGIYPYYGAASIMDYVDDYIFDGEYILFAEDGTVITDSGNPVLQYTKGKFWVNNHAHILKAKDHICQKYLWYAFSNINISGSITGAVQPKINQQALKAIEILLPSLEEQGAIAGVLGALDDKIEANRRQNETLESMAVAIFKSWFIDFEPFGGTMPTDWKEKALSDICRIVYGKGLPTNNLTKNGYPVFGGNGQIGFYKDFIYDEPQVIISCRGAASGKVMHSLKQSFITNNSLICEIKKGEELNRFYLERILKFIDMTRFTTGSAQPQITIENISSVPVLVPSEKVMYDFGKILEDIDAKMTFNDECSNNLAQVRDSLLPRLMSGKILMLNTTQDN